MPIFIRTRDDKYHLTELLWQVGDCYHGRIEREELVQVHNGENWCWQVGLPKHIKLCGLCLVRYLDKVNSRTHVPALRPGLGT